MRMIGSLPSFRFSRSPGLTLIAFVGVLCLAYEAAQLVIEGDVNTLVMSGLVFVGLAVVVAILNDWRRGLYLLFGWVLFEDLFRKYLGNNMAVFFTKDILTIVLYISFFAAKRERLVKSFRPPFFVPLCVFFWFGVIQVFNPNSNSIFYGILGMKVYFLYIPLIFVGYALIESENDLRKFLAFNAILVLIVTCLGIAQSVIGPKFLNPAVIQDDIRELSTLYRVAPISGLVAYRPTSVFVSAGRFSNFLIVCWLVALGFAGYLLLRSKKDRNLAFFCLAMVAVGSIMSASRGVFMWNAGNAMVVAAAFLWGAPWRQGEVRRVIRTIQRSLFAVGLGLLLMMTYFPEEVASRFAIYNETLSLDSPTSELAHRTRDYPLKNFLMAFDHPHWATGYGIGTATLGVQYVVRIMHAKPMGIGVENGYGQLIVELGVTGLVLWIFLSIAISVSAWKVARRLRGTPWFPLGFVIFWYAFTLLIPMSYIAFINYQDYVMNAYLWILLGILFRLPDLAQKTMDMEATANLAAESGQA
ncbi:MAG TPA: hypothetical protein VFI45_08865 [Candidatus Acidoferrum sp.]|nr:hypothetical protein [Candidatus Acidoferrum sp.]